MNPRNPALYLGVVCLAGVASAFGQFYAPDTEYHDLAQRFFVVETVRVLAWRENETQLKIGSVSYEVTTKPNRETTWRVQCLDLQSNLVREVTVTYPQSLLDEGPKFYRTVFQQIWKAGWRTPKAVASSNLTAEFWRGANEAGFSRAESLQAAWKFERAKPKEEQSVPHLAGLLQSAALPSTAGAVSLDALLLARSAAWLCLAEEMSEQPHAFDSCWAPTLWLAGRENAATASWLQQHQGPRLTLPVGAFSEGWEFVLRRPRAKAAFVYAAAKEHRAFTLPILAYYAGAAPVGSTVGNIMYPIFASDVNTLSRLYDYAPLLSVSTGVPGGRVLEGAFPAVARVAWLQAMEVQPLSTLDYSGHTKLIKKTLQNVTEAFKAPLREDTDPSLTGLAVASQMLTESYNSGTGPLIPISVATTRDVLNYGWESTCIQMETRYHFVNNIWGVKDLARSILTNTVNQVRGSSTTFLVTTSRTSPRESTDRLRRMQFADMAAHALSNPQVPIWGQNAAEDRLLYPRRCWLRPRLITLQVDGLVGTGQLPEIVPYLRKFHAQGGPEGDAMALQTLVNLPRATGLKIPGKQKLQEELAPKLIEPSILQLNTAWDEKYAKMPPLQRGQELEKIFWDAPTTGIHSWIFHNYLNAHANISVRRFYSQVAELLNEPISFANGIGAMRHMLALLEEDKPAMAQTLKDCDSGSYGNMMMLIRDAVYRDDLPAVKQQILEVIERYPKSSDKAMERLKNFVPLIPALRDAKHPDHLHALDYFANDSSLAVLQWMMLKKYNLGTREAVRFLGGQQTDPLRQALVSYLVKDKKRFRESFDEVSGTQRYAGTIQVLLLYLEKDLMQIPEPEGQKDLKPAKAETIEQAVINFLKQAPR